MYKSIYYKMLASVVNYYKKFNYKNFQIIRSSNGSTTEDNVKRNRKTFFVGISQSLFN